MAENHVTQRFDLSAKTKSYITCRMERLFPWHSSSSNPHSSVHAWLTCVMRKGRCGKDTTKITNNNNGRGKGEILSCCFSSRHAANLS